MNIWVLGQQLLRLFCPHLKHLVDSAQSLLIGKEILILWVQKHQGRFSPLLGVFEEKDIGALHLLLNILLGHPHNFRNIPGGQQLLIQLVKELGSLLPLHGKVGLLFVLNNQSADD